MVARLTDEAKIAEARAFCNQQYGRHGYITHDSDLFPEEFLGVYRNGDIHGTIGTYLSADLGGGPFPTEAAFGFSLADLGIDPATVGEVARLSGDGQMFVPVISFMTRYMAEELGLTYAMFGVKPFIEEGLRSMGIPTTVHQQFHAPILEEIPEEFRPYFKKGPTPIVVTVRLEDGLPAVKAHLARLNSG